MGQLDIPDRELLGAQGELALEDPWYLATEVLVLEDEVPRTSEELQPIYDWMHQPRPERLLKTAKWLRFWSSPRFTAKTYILLVYIFVRIVKNPNIRVIIQGQEKQMAVDSVKLLREWFRLPRVIQLFGSFEDKVGDLGQEEFTVSQRTKAQKDPTIRALGLDVPMQGKRCDIMAWDDLIGETNNNEEGIIKVEKRIAASMALVRPGGEAIYLCTRWNPYDPSTEKFTITGQPGILRQWQMHGNWDAPPPRGYFGAYAQPGDDMVFPHAQPGELLFPGIWSEASIAEAKVTWNHGFFSSQVLNNPIPDEDHYFTEEDIQYFDVYDSEGERSRDLVGCVFFMSVDPASGKPAKRGTIRDDTTFCVLGVKWQDQYPVGYVVEWRGGIWKPDRIQNVFFDLVQKWKPRQIYTETNIGGQYFIDPIRKRGKELGFDYLPIQDIHQTKQGANSGIKPIRIGSMQEHYNYRRIWHARDLKNSKGEDQLLRWTPNGAGHDDWADVLATAWINATARKIGSPPKGRVQNPFAMRKRYASTNL